MPNGTTYIPMTQVKNKAQAKIFGVPEGTPVAIAVPEECNPQGHVNQWSLLGMLGISHDLVGFAGFGLTWMPHGFNDYKRKKPIFDAYGNFEYGATGASANYPLWLLTSMGDIFHNGKNYPINTQDIESGFDAISNGGTLNIIDWNPGEREH